MLRAELEAEGFRPTKSRGQNFLVDPNAARSIALDAGLGPGARVLEIGAGCGFLTLRLAELGFRVLAVEIDARLLGIARRLLGPRENVAWIHADVLAGKHALSRAVLEALPKEPWHVVANLPYSISGPVLVGLARLPFPPESMTVLVQAELAERIAARPGGREWGALGARLARTYHARQGRSVGAQLFWPRPRVESRVAHLRLDPAKSGAPEELARFDALVELLFQQRRKQVLSTLSSRLGREKARELLRGASVEEEARPERLTVEALEALAASEAWSVAAEE